MSAAATAVTVFHPVADPQRFESWLADMTTCAGAAEGFVASRAAAYDDPTLDPAALVIFRTEDLLHRWLDGPECREVLRRGQALGFWARSSDLVLVEGDLPPDGVSVFMQSVAPGKEADFTATQAELAARAAVFPGGEGTIVFPASAGGEWMSIVRFRRDHQLDAWLQSRERADVLPAVRQNLTRNFSETALTTAYGSTVRTDKGQTRVTPGWKVAMVVLLTLYPAVMLLSRFLAPDLADLGAHPWLATFISNVSSVAVLQWVLMPTASKAFRRWLDPVDGAGLWVSLAGAAVIVACYAATLLVFAQVRVLQF
jgi:antibiotic biosynthesis monooxygenase (ABM) superfamily enzyme